MLFFPLLIACASEAPAPAPEGRERRHHAALPEDVAPKELDEDRPMPVGNRAPLIRSVRLQPANPDVTRTLSVQVDAKDPEGEDVDVDVQWIVDGRELPGAGETTLELADLRRGAAVQVRVRVSDPGGESVESTSEPLTLGNADPRFLTDPKAVRRLDGLRVEAEDPDGDPVSFRVEGAPPGVTLDPRGVFHYAGSEDEKGGKYRMKIFAEDGNGGQARMELPLDISPGSKAAVSPTDAPQ